MSIHEYLSTEDLKKLREEEEEENATDGVVCLSTIHSRNLRMIERKAGHIQYLLACLSTLGGAHHLCNKPLEALQLALQQESVGRRLGSTQVVLRAQVFQAVNLCLLGKAEQGLFMFKCLENRAKKESWSNMLGFVRASKKWVKYEMRMITDQGEEKGENVVVSLT